MREEEEEGEGGSWRRKGGRDIKSDHKAGRVGANLFLTSQYFLLL